MAHGGVKQFGRFALWVAAAAVLIVTAVTAAHLLIDATSGPAGARRVAE